MNGPQWNGSALDADGLYHRAPNTIATWTGEHVDPLNLRDHQVNIKDIGHSLARQCRYAGHTEGYLSVARHSIIVSHHLETQGEPFVIQMWGLLHDAAEAYLVDVPRPLKQHPAMAFYLEAEARAERIIAQVFNLPYPVPGVVKDADRFVLLERELAAGGLRDHYFGDFRTDEYAFMHRYKSLHNLCQVTP